jgi:ATP-dependent DNA ligase
LKGIVYHAETEPERTRSIFNRLFDGASERLSFAAAWGLEGLVSKRRDRPYQAGRLKTPDQGEEPEATLRWSA